MLCCVGHIELRTSKQNAVVAGLLLLSKCLSVSVCVRWYVHDFVCLHVTSTHTQPLWQRTNNIYGDIWAPANKILNKLRCVFRNIKTGRQLTIHDSWLQSESSHENKIWKKKNSTSQRKKQKNAQNFIVMYTFVRMRAVWCSHCTHRHVVSCLMTPFVLFAQKSKNLLERQQQFATKWILSFVCGGWTNFNLRKFYR